MFKQIWGTFIMKKISLYFSLIWGGGINFLFFETNLEINFFQYIFFYLEYLGYFYL